MNDVKYYKIMTDSEFIGVGTTLSLRRFQKKHQILLTCDESQAQYIQYNEKLYHTYWMLPITSDKYAYEEVTVVKIEKSEYDILLKSIESGDEIVIEPEITEPEQEEEYIDPNTQLTLEYVKEQKIATLNATCNQVITNGFDVILSDGQPYHFSLTTQDQLNLITLSSLVASGQTEIPYHADGELCRYYSVQDINTILDTATAFKTYHVTYFNSLKAYVNSLATIEEVSAIEYGCAIPEEYQSDILKDLIAQMAQNGVM